MLNTRHLSSLAALTFIGLTGVTGAAIAAGPSSQFDLKGDVVTPGVDTLSSLSALPATTETATYKAGGGPVMEREQAGSVMPKCGALTQAANKSTA
jgi:hypothetical protein